MEPAKLNIKKQVAFWRESATEDWNVGRDLVRRGKTRHGLFFLHLALEKILKAHVCRKTGDLAPKTHALARLAELSGLKVSAEEKDILADFTRYNIAGRYPESLGTAPSSREAREKLRLAQEVYEWLRNQF